MVAAGVTRKPNSTGFEAPNNPTLGIRKKSAACNIHEFTRRKRSAISPAPKLHRAEDRNREKSGLNYVRNRAVAARYQPRVPRSPDGYPESNQERRRTAPAATFYSRRCPHEPLTFYRTAGSTSEPAAQLGANAAGAEVARYVPQIAGFCSTSSEGQTPDRRRVSEIKREVNCELF